MRSVIFVKDMNIPQLLFQTDTCFPALQALEKIYVPASLDVIYNPRYSYRQRAIKNDIDTIQTLFLNSPAVREPALQLIGLLCHECINITFLKREKQHQVGKRTNNSLGNLPCAIFRTLADHFDTIQFEETSIHAVEVAFVPLQ
ncbi:hypothetical protein M3Y97_00082000 [Aphelenchoides bicaudatus]|nr:hypothetical protein M3Y97_00082000 [Aphelenchoides bicaudatus]